MSAAVGVREDPEDGRPAWDPKLGAALVPGLLAWHRLAVGHRRETWLCWSVRHWDAVLLKVVRPGWTRPVWTAALGREVQALRALDHPAFPRLLADGTRAALPHLVTDYFNGPALDEVVDEDGRLEAADIANLGVQLLTAVRYLHGTGRGHLDICPDNVVTVAARGYLIDLGAARRLGSRLTRGERVGTESYTAPELEGWTGTEITPALDLFGVGATLRWALDPAGDPGGVVSEVVARLCDPCPSRRPTADAALAALVRQAGSRSSRPWPWWADRYLTRGDRRPPRTSPGRVLPLPGAPRPTTPAEDARVIR